jgi:peptidoglycan/LPS O-acetylase OafA/YrhL
MRFPVYLQVADYYANFSQTFNFYAVWLHRFVFVLALLAVILLLEPSIKQGGGALFRRIFEVPFWRVFSKMAFPMYLFHFPFIALGWLLVLRTTELSGFNQITLWQTLQAFFFATILVTWFSLPLHFKLENKAIGLGKRLARRFS